MLLENAWRLGYSGVLCDNYDPNTTKPPRMKVVKKLIIDAENSSKLKSQLKGVNPNSVFITVHPYSTEVARWSAHDTRIDSILMTPNNMKLFDRKQLSVMKYYSKPLEIHLPHLIQSENDVRGALYRRLNLFVRGGSSLLLGSAAEHWTDIYPPISIVKFLSTHYDIPEGFSRVSLTDVPRQIIIRKLGPRWP